MKISRELCMCRVSVEHPGANTPQITVSSRVGERSVFFALSVDSLLPGLEGMSCGLRALRRCPQLYTRLHDRL